MKNRYDKRIGRHDSKKVYREQGKPDHGKSKQNPWGNKGKNQFKKPDKGGRKQ